MQGHEFFHERAHLELRHEFKRGIFLVFLLLFSFLFYRFFCHFQELEADRVAAEKCGRGKALESLKFLRLREGKTGFWASVISSHPGAERRIREIF
jgi:Zn-dependent protease with chaperone function